MSKEPSNQEKNKLIPADQLHWVEEEKGYRIVSKEECLKLRSLCENLSEKDFIKAFTHYQNYRVSHLLWENLKEGMITISGVSEDGQPIFAPIETLKPDIM